MDSPRVGPSTSVPWARAKSQRSQPRHPAAHGESAHQTEPGAREPALIDPDRDPPAGAPMFVPILVGDVSSIVGPNLAGVR
jgi:hypothetical protein